MEKKKGAKAKFLIESRRDNLSHDKKFGNGKQQSDNLAMKREFCGGHMMTECM